MGCWYETCAVSNLVIPPRAPTRLIILERTYQLEEGAYDWGRGFSYADEVWTPRYLPLLGKYDDDIGTIKGVKTDLNVEVILRDLSENGVLDEEEAEDKITKSTNLAKWLHWIERGYLKVNSTRKATPTGQMLVLDEVYQFMVDTAENYVLGERKLREDRLNQVGPVALKNFSSNWLYPQTLKQLGHSVRVYSELEPKGRGTDSPEIEPLRKASQDFVRFAFMLDVYRKSYMPTAGKGSQDHNEERMAAFSDKVKEIAVRRLKEYEEDL